MDEHDPSDDARDRYRQTAPAESFSPEGMREPLVAAAVSAEQGPRLPGANATARLRRDGSGADARSDARYQVEGTLGVGATGEVWSVRDRTLDRLLAVKVLRAELLDDREGVSGFLDEARMTASLSHPNVLPVHDFDLAEDGRPFFSMARIGGRSLGSAIEGSTPAARHAAIGGVNAVVSIAIAVCNAAAYAHHQGIVHQDIKPDNIMLGDFGEVLLLDWGSAGRIAADGKLVGRLYGTPTYMSPEQARREGADRRSDIYCIGATLFHALTLRLPIWSDDAQEFWELKRAGIVAPPTLDEKRATAPALLAIALQAMAADLAARYQSVDDLRRDLERFQAGLAVAAYHEPWWLRLRRWHRAHARAAWASLAAAALVVGALSFAIVERLKERSAWRELATYRVVGASVAELQAQWRLHLRADWSDAQPFVERPLAEGGHVVPVADGIMLVGENEIADLTLARPLRGDFAVEWDYRGVDTPRNLNCFIGDDRSHGFTFHVGGFGSASHCMLTKDGALMLQAPLPVVLDVSRANRFRVEREERHIRLLIDGRLVVDWFDAEDLGGGIGQVFGLDCVIAGRTRIGDVHVFQRPLAQRISPVEVGDKLFRLGLWDEAAAQYGEIRDAYPGTVAARTAEFRLASCLDKRGEAATATAAFAAFAAAHAQDELAPFALAQCARIARALGDAAQLDRARRALVAYRGHPLLFSVMRAITDDLTEPFKRLDPSAAVQAGPAVQREAIAWCTLYGRDPAMDLGVLRIAEIMDSDQLHREALAMPVVGADVRAGALRSLGRFDEALAVPGIEAGTRGDILYGMGRLREAADLPGAAPDVRMAALYCLGDFAGMRAVGPNHQLTEDLGIYEGHLEEYLAMHPTDIFGYNYGMTPRAMVLIALRRYDQLLREYQHGDLRVAALLGLGRDDEALLVPGCSVDRDAKVALWRLMLGQPERARACIGTGAATQLLAVVLGAGGDTQEARVVMTRVRDDNCYRDMQRDWYLARYALGEIDDATFLAQPARLQVQARLLFARALRREIAGDSSGAAVCWRDYLALPHWQRETAAWTHDLACWRIRGAGLEVPAGARVPTMPLCYH